MVWPTLMRKLCHSFYWQSQTLRLTPPLPSYGVEKCQSIKWHILRSSGDARMRALYTLRRCKDAKLTKWYAATIELECTEASVGSGTLRPLSSSSHRAGLGGRPPEQHSKPPRKDLLQTFEEINAQEQILRLKTLQVQGKWLEWTSVRWQDLSWTIPFVRWYW